MDLANLSKWLSHKDTKAVLETVADTPVKRLGT